MKYLKQLAIMKTLFFSLVILLFASCESSEPQPPYEPVDDVYYEGPAPVMRREGGYIDILIPSSAYGEYRAIHLRIADDQFRDIQPPRYQIDPVRNQTVSAPAPWVRVLGKRTLTEEGHGMKEFMYIARGAFNHGVLVIRDPGMGVENLHFTVRIGRDPIDASTDRFITYDL